MKPQSRPQDDSLLFQIRLNQILAPAHPLQSQIRRDRFPAAPACPSNPYDGYTLNTTLQQVESTTGVALSDVHVDRGCRGHDHRGEAEAHISGRGSKSAGADRKRCRRRHSAIELKIGHAEADKRPGRCYLKGSAGDAMNAALAAAGANVRKLLRLLPRALVHLLRYLSLRRVLSLTVLQPVCSAS